MAFFIKIPKCPESFKNTAFWCEYTKYVNIINGHSTIDQRELRRSGYAAIEPDTVATFLNICSHLIERHSTICVFDVGSNSGMYSIAAKAIFSDCVSIHAFEPAPDSFCWLSHISKVNNFSFILNQLALTDTTGVAEFYISKKSDASNSLEQKFRDHKDVIHVNTNTLDRYITTQGSSPHLIKIDAETFDYYVLKGGMDYIKKERPYIICEVLNSDLNDYDLLISSLISEVDGYLIYFIDLHGELVKKDSVRSDPKLTNREWFFCPETLTEEFFATNRAWRLSVAECHAGENFNASSSTLLKKKPTTTLIGKIKKAWKKLRK